MSSPGGEFAHRPGTPKPIRCVVCLEWKAVSELYREEGDVWDICLACAERKRATLDEREDGN